MTDKEALKQDRELARMLTNTWPVFFARFGRLTEVQRKVIPHLLRGQDLVICAPTASGKTEAVCAPLLERHIASLNDWLLLYVSPTRALVNDLYERLILPVNSLGLRMSRRTGDHHERIEAAHIILTTPESFDSMLCRGKIKGKGHCLAPTVAVVLDEIHFMYGNPRGEQLRWLLQRLGRLRKYAKQKGWVLEDSLQKVILGATIPFPEMIRDSYLHLDAPIFIIPGGREIETISLNSSDPSTELSLPEYVRNLSRPEKILVFCNTRKRVDKLSESLRETLLNLGYSVRAHHGSLSKNIREEAEAAMKSMDKITLFATSTLELGIDIGDIDLIVLDGPAPDLCAFLQRIGRGNRRTNKTRVMNCSGNLAQVIIHSAMVEDARVGELGSLNYGPCHSVARQQISSYIFQAPRRSRNRSMLVDLVNSCMEQKVGGSVLDHMIAQDEIKEDHEGIRLGDNWLESCDRGEIHSNIEGTYGVTVIDEVTGKEFAKGISFGGGKILQIGGSLLEVRKWGERKLEVRKASKNAKADASWSYCCRAWTKGSGQPEAVRRYLEFSELEWPVLYNENSLCVFHFGGNRRRSVLEMILGIAHRAHEAIKVNNWFLTLEDRKFDGKPSWLKEVGPATLEVSISRNIDRLERTLGRPLSNKKLPIDVRVDEVRQWLQLGKELKHFEDCIWVPVSDPDKIIALKILCQDISEL